QANASYAFLKLRFPLQVSAVDRALVVEGGNMNSLNRLPALLVGCTVVASGQTAATGRLDFLKAHDSSFALLANTSATFQTGKHFPNELFLITGLPFAPAISARVDLALGDPH